MRTAVRTRPLLHRHVVCADPFRRTEVLVGHPSRPLPVMASTHWGGECGFGMRLLEDGPGWPRIEHHEGLTLWRRGDVSARFYPTAGLTPHDHDGGFEFDITLARRPVANVLRFLMRSAGLRFYFQPEGEPHVKGSYAVYHASRVGNFPGVHYRAGKACHVYRPWAEDADGRRVWCDLRMPLDGNGLATLTIPQWFIDGAAYPVLVDPTFGYTTVGATVAPTISNTSNAFGSMQATYSAASGQQITKFSVYCDDSNAGGSNVIGVAAYSITSSVPDARLAAGVTITVPQTGTPSWLDTAAVGQALSSGTTYGLAVGDFALAGFVLNLYYDTLSGTLNSRNTSAALTATWSSGSTTARAYSFYATYAAAPKSLVFKPPPTAVLFT